MGFKMRRVAFMVSDNAHKITPVSVFMPVRTKEQADNGPVYEGPINATWERKVRPALLPNFDPAKWWDDGGVSLVGVLFADYEHFSFGRINWLKQTETAANEEEGAELLAEAATEDA